MGFSVRNFCRKWSCRGLMSISGRAAMVTAALGLALTPAAPAQARKYVPQLFPLLPPLDLLGSGAPRHRRTVHTAHTTRPPLHIPLPKPRPADAPQATKD